MGRGINRMYVGILYMACMGWVGMRAGVYDSHITWRGYVLCIPGHAMCHVLPLAMWPVYGMGLMCARIMCYGLRFV